MKKYMLFILLFIVYSACNNIRTKGPLLKDCKYKIWYIKHTGNENPEFLYIDRYGRFYSLGLDIETGYFFPISNNFYGKWRYISDTSIYLNNNIYSINSLCDTFTYKSYSIGTGLYKNPDSIYYSHSLQVLSLKNEVTNDSILLRDTRFPIDLSTPFYSEKNEEEKHFQKWKKHIKKSVLLDGKDYKLWHTGEKILSPNNYDYFYYNKYGKESLVYLYRNKWYFSNPHESELAFVRNWHQNKDTVYYDDTPYEIIKKNDTIWLIQPESRYEQILIDTHITPSK